MRTRLSGPMRAAVLAIALAALVTLIDLGSSFDLTVYLRVGEHASARSFVEADFPDTHLAPGWGHDGQANYVLSRTLPDLHDAEGHLDSVTYRARRIVYPALTAPLPDGTAVLVGFWLLNLAGIGIAAAAVARLAQDHGASWWAGASVGLSPAFLTSMAIHLGDALALGLAIAGLVAWRRPGATHWAIVLFTLAALTRETTLLIPAAVFLLEGKGRRLALVVPPAALFAWMAVLAIWIGDPGKSSAQFRLPFLGWADQGFGSFEIMTALVFALLSLWAMVRLRSIDATLALILLFDVAMLVIVDRAVLFNTRNLSRVVPWVLPFAIIAAELTWQSARAGRQPANTHSVVNVTP